ncbi:hypothetical protein CDAR_227191 [Caerostris darwini]|uniref:Uncharacterized protein n=1 Tax=Caerostris darwini TaxID=1538125 RepID=A0AAV4PAI1_9ARAC|nr:hypothetical protein CDAR_227191 [Caerostris darwini]
MQPENTKTFAPSFQNSSTSSHTPNDVFPCESPNLPVSFQTDEKSVDSLHCESEALTRVVLPKTMQPEMTKTFAPIFQNPSTSSHTPNDVFPCESPNLRVSFQTDEKSVDSLHCESEALTR